MDRAYIGGHAPIAGNGAPQVKQRVLSHGIMGAPQLLVRYNEQQFTPDIYGSKRENWLGRLSRLFTKIPLIR